MRFGRVKRAFLGIQMQQIELVPKLRSIAQVTNHNALFITKVEIDSPAEKAGILSGDILYSFNDQAIETSDQLFKLLGNEKIGMFQFVGVIRNTLKKEFRITPTEKLAA